MVRVGGELALATGPLFMYDKIMGRSISVGQKKRSRGRPATGHDPQIALRMPTETRQAVEAWAANQPDKPSLSEAIRRMVDLVLAAKASVTKRATTKRKEA